jgi:acyl carrier protein
MAQTDAIREQIRSFIIENFLMGDASSMPGDTQSFLENGVIDSTGVLEVISFLEEKFEFRVDDKDLVPENIDSVDNLARYIKDKTGAA